MSANPQASALQARASDPKVSAWVNANAGSGKTHVLVDRVVRLLLAGTEPSRIMCLTFTKAAAAEMSNRLFERLSAWVPLDDASLRQSLENLGTRDIDADLLRRARQLFTRALETPGGLKIQTIHAFCERVLQLFPVEAGIVPRFTVMDDRLAADLMRQARDQTLAAALQAPDSALGLAVTDVAGRVQADGFEALMSGLLRQRANIRAVLDGDDGIIAALGHLRGVLGIGPDESNETLERELTIDRTRLARFAAALDGGSKTDVERAVYLRIVLGNAQSTLFDLQHIFLTLKDEPRKSLATKPVLTAHPWISDFVAGEQARLQSALGKRADLERIAATGSLLVVGAAILSAYETAKRRHGAYDFEDLIIRTGELLAERPDAAWVLYKLDGGIEHLLIDEAQDTSPAQWRIIKALTEEFFSGAGSHGGKRRTIFAVGDRKQSIYSFQGADPDIFEQVHDEFADHAGAAQQPFSDVDLTVSFRSTREVLHAVDTVFGKNSPARDGLDSSGVDLVHQTNRPGENGLVELWPLIEPQDGGEDDPWTAPVDREAANSPRRRLAARLAATIKSWIGKRVIAATGKVVKPGDILVLVRVRNVFFDALIRELRQAGVPVAGADRLKLIDNIAVLDLLALARFCLMPEDDYALACILKSPVPASPLSEDELMHLAIGRGTATLWDALRQSAEPVCIAAAAQLGRLAAAAASARPFEFFSGVLMQARMRFLSRLGSEANDALDALLDAALGFEESHGTSLAGFVNWFETGEAVIKRNMEQDAGEVRIMTVHGAKGLEAPIVILPDTVSMPDSRNEPPLLMVEAGNAGAKIPLWKLSKLYVSTPLQSLKTDLRDDQTGEYRRLLYVAMTRARDELYICGCHGSQPASADCWYEMAAGALKTEMREADGVWRLGLDPLFVSSGAAAVLDAAPRPGWLDRPYTEEYPGADPVSISTLVRDAAEAPPAAAMTRGSLIHRILQHLPDVPLDARAPQARRMALKAGFGEDLAGSLVALMAAPHLALVFAPDGLSEIPLVAELPDLGLTVTGRIDRLVLAGDIVLAIDYKTTPRPPASPEDVSPGDLAQLAAYRMALRLIHPGAEIRMALLYTETQRLMELPGLLLDRGLDHLAVKRP